MSHLSAERIRQIEKEALEKAKKYLARNGYASKDFFIDTHKGANNVRESGKKVEEGKDCADAQP